MKKGLLFFGVIIFAVLLLAACGTSKPKNMTQATYDSGCRALEIMEKYNDLDVSAEDAEVRLKGIEETLEKEHDELTDILESTNCFLVKTDIYFFITAMQGTTGDTYEIEEQLRERLER